MENKYYIPDISEFYVGFEAEELLHYFNYAKQEAVNEWRPFTFEFEDLIYGIEVIKEPRKNVPNSIRNFNYEAYKFPYDEKRKEQYYPYRSALRVKYLDQEDIESLGFVKDDREYDYYKECSKENYYLYYDNHQLVIATVYNYIPKQVLFDGIVKNKSELKKVLKMINVIE